MINSPLPPYEASEFLTSWNNEDIKGRGSFACVRKCEHKQLGKVVAKCFNITGSSEKYEEAVKEVEREIEVLFRLNHKNIVQIRGITRWANNIGIIMECMDGGNLEDLLMSKDVPDIPLLLRLRFFHDIADGLSHIHHYNVKKAFVHSDLKPQNILLTPDLMIKIADFGSVNVAMESNGASASLKLLPSTQFTEFYAAPEVLKNPFIKKKPSMDVYSYAMIGYEILTRRQVYLGANHNIVIQTIKDQGQKPDLRLFREVEKSLEGKPQDLEIFKFLENLIIKCWEYEAEKRPDILDVRNEINKKFKSVDVSKHSYHINDMRLKNKLFNKPPTTNTPIKIELSKFHFSFEEGPMPLSHQTVSDPKVTTGKMQDLTLKGESSRHYDEQSLIHRKTQLVSTNLLEEQDNNNELIPAKTNVPTKHVPAKRFLGIGSQTSKGQHFKKSDLYTETNITTKDVPVASPEKTITQPVPTKQSLAVRLQASQDQHETNMPIKDVPSTTHPVPANIPLGMMSQSSKDHYENNQAGKMSETLMQQIQQFSNKKKWNKDDGLQTLSLWVQLYELKDSSLMKRAAEYFPSMLSLSEIHLNEDQVRAFSEILRFTKKYIEMIDLSWCHLHTSLFGQISTALLESHSTVGKLNISYNQLDEVKDIADLIPRIRRKLVMFASFTDGRGGTRFANEEEQKRIKKILYECNKSLKVEVAPIAPITILQSKR